MPNDVVDGMQFAGGQDGLELKIGYVHRHVGIYPLIADPGNKTPQEVGRLTFRWGGEKPNMLHPFWD